MIGPLLGADPSEPSSQQPMASVTPPLQPLPCCDAHRPDAWHCESDVHCEQLAPVQDSWLSGHV